MAESGSRILGPGLLSVLPTEVLWRVLAQLELTDLLSVTQTCHKAHKRLGHNDDFWHFLYYLHLIPSPLYYDVQHVAMIDPPTATWKYMYFEQLWIQCAFQFLCSLATLVSISDLFAVFGLLHSPYHHVLAQHRTLASERDATWQIVEETPRAAFGPFAKPIAPLAFIHHLGFKQTKKKATLDPGEVTGCFNFSSDWKHPDPYTNIFTLLPDPYQFRFYDESFSNEQAEARINEYCARVDPNELESTKSRFTWFTRGIRGFVNLIAVNLDQIGPFRDHWQECTETEARKVMLMLLTKTPPFTEAEDLSAELNDLHLSNPTYETPDMTEDAGIKVVSAAFRLAKLGPPTVQMPLVESPTRFFIVSNFITSPFESRHHHAILLVSPYRMILLVFEWGLDEEQQRYKNDGMSNLMHALSSCLGR
jgi:hypothetical protein